MNPTNAPTPVTLSDGSVVIVSPLTAKDMTTIFNFVRQKELSRLLTAIPKDTDPETKKMMIKLAYEESSQFSIADNSVIWQDLEVIKETFFLALKKETMGMTLEKVDSIMQDEKNMELILSAINGKPKDDDSTGADSETQKKTE